MRKIVEFAAAYDTKTANAFLQGAVQAESVSGFREAFKTFYGAGRLGKMSYDEYRQTAEGRIIGGKLTKEAAKAAFDGGRKAAEAEKASSVAQTPSVASKGRDSSPASGGAKREGNYKNSAAIDQAVDTMLELLAKKTGFDIERLQQVSGGKVEANGRFIRALCKMEISDNAQNFFGDLEHELTHGAAAFNPEGYSGYAGAVMQWYQQTYGSGSAMDRLQEIYDVYHQNDESFTMADALEEFTSEANAGLFSSEEGVRDFLQWLQSESGYTAEQKKTVLQKAAELLQKIFARIKELLRDGHLSSVAKDFAQAQADEASRLRQMFLEVLDGMEVREGATEQSGEKYSLKRMLGKSWDEQMKMLYDDKTVVHSDTLTFGEVPSFLVDVGIENKQLAIPLGVLSDGQSGRDANHSIRRKEVRALGKKIMNPSIVIDNVDRNSLVFVLNPEKGDVPILVAFRKNMVFDGDDVHAARSFHFQPSIDAMIRKLSDQSRVFINKNRLYNKCWGNQRAYERKKNKKVEHIW